MGTDWAHTRYAQDARTLKALHIVDTLRAVGCDAVTAARLNEDQRRKAEKAAGQRKGSDDTWALVVKMLREGVGLSHAAAPVTERVPNCPTCEHTDGRGPILARGHEGDCRPCPACGHGHTWVEACATVGSVARR